MKADNTQTAVIVPARNAASTLPAALEALAAQDHAEPFDVIVVDDGSSDGTAAIARAADVRVVTTPGAGPAAARNAGAEATTAPLLAFTDADCRPGSSWLRAGTAALRQGADLARGPILPARPPEGFDKTIRVTGPSPLFESANLFVRRETWLATGGFERPAFLPDSVPHFGEDVLFGWRAVRRGAVVAFEEDAVVVHEVFPRGPRAYVAERWRLRLFPPLAKEAPELRGAMPLRVFLSGRTARADLALVGIVAAVRLRSTLPLAAALPYARRELAFPPPWKAGVARYDAAAVAADLVGLAALVYGSIRHRTLVL